MGVVDISVDVGEETEFTCTLEDVIHCSPLWLSENSAIAKIIQLDGTRYLTCFKWSKVKWEVNNKAYAYLSSIDKIGFVPVCYDRSVYKVGRTYVSMITRSYIRGEPASVSWHTMSTKEKNALAVDVCKAVSILGQNKSRKFGSVQYYKLATDNAYVFLNYKILLSKLARELNEDDITLNGEDSFPSTPSLCHGDLSLDHIIVHDGHFSGIVGWSRCEFTPEVLDRIMYYFLTGPSSAHTEWFRNMAQAALLYSAMPPMFLVSSVYYYYHMALKRTPVSDAWKVEKMLQEVMDEAFDNDSDTLETGGDEVSLNNHTQTDLLDCATDPFSDRAEVETLQDYRKTIDTWEVYSEAESDIINILSRAII